MVRREVRETGRGTSRRGPSGRPDRASGLPTAPISPFFLGHGNAAGVQCVFRRAGRGPGRRGQRSSGKSRLMFVDPCFSGRRELRLGRLFRASSALSAVACCTTAFRSSTSFQAISARRSCSRRESFCLLRPAAVDAAEIQEHGVLELQLIDRSHGEYLQGSRGRTGRRGVAPGS